MKLAIAPYASRHPYECWILPREHSPDFETSDADAFLDLAAVLKALLERLEAVLPEPAYNLFLYSGPSRDRRVGYWTTLDQDFHWHIAILPRLTQVAGFEVGTGFYANTVTPETAAATLREQPCEAVSMRRRAICLLRRRLIVPHASHFTCPGAYGSRGREGP